MSPGNWVAIIMGLVAVCWVAGVYIEIADYQIDEMRAKADMEDMLKADSNSITYNQARKGAKHD